MAPGSAELGDEGDLMSAMTIQAQIRSLEAQLSVLKAQLAAAADPAAARARFGDLYGVLSGKSDTTEEELHQAEYGFEWDDRAQD